MLLWLLGVHRVNNVHITSQNTLNVHIMHKIATQKRWFVHIVPKDGRAIHFVGENCWGSQLAFELLVVQELFFQEISVNNLQYILERGSSH